MSMSVYTVHAPPQQTAEALADAERYVFVRDGFAMWAFLLTPFWLLWHRLWLVLAIYLVVSAGLETLLVLAGASAGVVTLVGVLISFFVGLEASTLRRLTLSLRGWKNVGLVSGYDIEDAERRFFDGWTREDGIPPATPMAGSTAGAMAGGAGPPGVIGLFPERG
jgi:hypothetical protein